MPAYREFRCGRCHLPGVICVPADDHIPITETYEWQCPSCRTVMMTRGEAWTVGECPPGAVPATLLPPGP